MNTDIADQSGRKLCHSPCFIIYYKFKNKKLVHGEGVHVFASTIIRFAIFSMCLQGGGWRLGLFKKKIKHREIQM